MAEPKSPYQVVARRFRPKSFDEVVGQDSILASLRTALTSGRIPHAFLFSGSRGVGKTTSARILARALNCDSGPTAEPCGRCSACTSILAGTNPDVVEIDAASHNLVDDVRELRDRVGFASMGSRYKVYILDEAHMLTRSAFNAFLKTLEEPPPRVVFVLATTELHKVPETIRSRCQVLLFQRIGEAEIVARLRAICDREGVALTESVLIEIARGSRGGMRDAETMLERVLPAARELGEAFDVAEFRRWTHRIGADRTVEVVARLSAGDAAAGLRFVDSCIQGGLDEREVLGEVVDVLRAALVLKIDGPESGLLGGLDSLRAPLTALAATADVPRLDAMIQAALAGRERLRRLDDRRLVLELAFVRMAQAGTLPTLADLAAELRGDAPTRTAVHTPAPSPARSIAPAAAPAPATASAPATTPAAPSSAASGLPVGSLLQRLVERMRPTRPALVPTLELCTFDGPDARGVVRVAVNTDRKLHRDRIAAEGVQQELRAALRELLGADVTLQFQAASVDAASSAATPSTGPVATPASRPSSAAKAPPGPKTMREIERFDGDIVDEGTGA